MSDPHVAAIMLIADRRDLGERAVACFRAQTYANKSLVIFDTGKEPFRQNFKTGLPKIWWWEESHGRTIGELRNAAAEVAVFSDIIVHWDSDDWSHPRRIDEQVALLKEGSAGCVGYSDMLFWREEGPIQRTRTQLGILELQRSGQAWLWSGAQNRPIGTSLCYWRRIWEANPFARLPIGGSTGEDVDFVRRVDCFGQSSLGRWSGPTGSGYLQPRMVARIHAGNTSTGYGQIESSLSWKRFPTFDDFCRKVMA
jgi:hypothetical protein